jgi:hypothetical protein
METLSFLEFARRYCERQVNTPQDLYATLEAQHRIYAPDGWVLLECKGLSSSRLGSYTILPYGPKNTYKEPPAGLISPRGLASDMSEAVAVLLAKDLKYPPLS